MGTEEQSAAFNADRDQRWRRYRATAPEGTHVLSLPEWIAVGEPVRSGYLVSRYQAYVAAEQAAGREPMNHKSWQHAGSPAPVDHAPVQLPIVADAQGVREAEQEESDERRAIVAQVNEDPGSVIQEAQRYASYRAWMVERDLLPLLAPEWKAVGMPTGESEYLRAMKADPEAVSIPHPQPEYTEPIPPPDTSISVSLIPWRLRFAEVDVLYAAYGANAPDDDPILDRLGWMAEHRVEIIDTNEELYGGEFVQMIMADVDASYAMYLSSGVLPPLNKIDWMNRERIQIVNEETPLGPRVPYTVPEGQRVMQQIADAAGGAKEAGNWGGIGQPEVYGGQPVERWEYRVVAVVERPADPSTSLFDALNTIGADGWHVIHIESHGILGYRVVAERRAH